MSHRALSLRGCAVLAGFRIYLFYIPVALCSGGSLGASLASKGPLEEAESSTAPTFSLLAADCGLESDWLLREPSRFASSCSLDDAAVDLRMRLPERRHAFVVPTLQCPLREHQLVYSNQGQESTALADSQRRQEEGEIGECDPGLHSDPSACRSAVAQDYTTAAIGNTSGSGEDCCTGQVLGGSDRISERSACYSSRSVQGSAPSRIPECAGQTGSCKTRRPDTHSLTSLQSEASQAGSREGSRTASAFRCAMGKLRGADSRQLQQAAGKLSIPEEGIACRFGGEATQASRTPGGDQEAFEPRSSRGNLGWRTSSQGCTKCGTRGTALGCNASYCRCRNEGFDGQSGHATIPCPRWPTTSEGLEDGQPNQQRIEGELYGSYDGADFKGHQATTGNLLSTSSTALNSDVLWMEALNPAKVDPFDGLEWLLFLFLSSFEGIFNLGYFENFVYFLDYSKVREMLKRDYFANFVFVQDLSFAYFQVPWAAISMGYDAELFLSCLYLWICLGLAVVYEGPWRTPTTTRIGGIRHPRRGRLHRNFAFKGALFCALIGMAESQSILKGIQCSIGERLDTPFDFLPDQDDLDELEPTPPQDHVFLMNWPRLHELYQIHTEAHEQSDRVRLITFGFLLEHIDRRDTFVDHFEAEEIRAAIGNLWSDYAIDYDLDIYEVDPQPDRLAVQGFSLLVHVRGDDLHSRGGLVLTLKEIVVYRRNLALRPELPEHEAFSTVALATVPRLISRAGLDERCNEKRFGHCTILHKRRPFLLRHEIRLRYGELLTFLVDEAQCDPQQVIHFGDVSDFQLRFQRTLGHLSPMQFLTAHLHGFRAGYAGTQSFSAHRHKVNDLGKLAAAVMGLWHHDTMYNVLVQQTTPFSTGLLDDGSVEVHFLVVLQDDPFEPPVRAVLRRGPYDFTVVETMDHVTTAALLRTSRWSSSRYQDQNFVLTWKDKPLPASGLFEIQNASLIDVSVSTSAASTREPPQETDTEADGAMLLQWSASDRVHGRTVGANSWKALPPPGNGDRSVHFSSHIYVVDQGISSILERIVNPFASAFCDALMQDALDADYNVFQADLRRDALWSPRPSQDNPFLQNLEDDVSEEAFKNGFVSRFLNLDVDPQPLLSTGDLTFHGSQVVALPTTITTDPHDVGQDPRKIDLAGLVQPSTIMRPPNVLFPAGEPWQSEAIDFRQVFAVLQWLDRRVTIPDFATPEGLQWHEASSDWAALKWWDDAPIIAAHFYSDGSHRKDASGAAVILFVQILGGEWQLGGFKAVQTPKSGSYFAELMALLIAYKWAYDLLRFGCLELRDVQVHFDSTSAGFRAAGYWSGSTFIPLVAALRSLDYLSLNRFATSIACHHVQAHAGHPGNEMANSLAYWAAHPSTPLVDSCLLSLSEGQHDQELPWLHFLYRPELCPFWHGGCLQLPVQAHTGPTADALMIEHHKNQATLETTFSFEMKMTTADVLTLMPDDNKEAGALDTARLESLLLQAKEAGSHIICMQETRLRTSTSKLTKDFILFQSAARSGHGGILLGFSRHLAFGYYDHHHRQQELYFQKDHFSLLKYTERMLILRVIAPGLKIIIVGAHAPQSGSPDANIRAWWQELHQSIPHTYRYWPIVLLGDLNARVGSLNSAAIGTHDGDPENLNGELLHAWLSEKQSWLPSTWSQCQQGPSGTWQHAASGKWARLDYIALPADFKCVKAWVDLEYDLALKRTDHLAASVVMKHVAKGMLPELQVYRRKTRESPETQEIFQNLERVQLNVHPGLDVHSHTEELTQHLLRLTQDTSVSSKSKRGSALSEATWLLIQTKKLSRNKLFWWQRDQRWCILRWCFAAWKRGSSEDLVEDLRLHDREIATTWSQFRSLGRAVTKAVRADTKKFFQGIAPRIGELDNGSFTKELWASIRRRFPKFKQRHQGFNPSQIEVLDSQWLPHFSQLEAGSLVTPEMLLLQCHARQQVVPFTRVPVRHFSELPNILEVEKALRATKPGKAPGPEGVLPGALHWGAKHLAEEAHGLFCKAFVQQAEPLTFKGGTVVPIHKRASPLEADNYRGIVLLPVLAKTLHAILRARIVAAVRPTKPIGLLGGFPHQRVTFGNHAVQAFGDLAALHGLSSGVLFIDLKHAYHHVIRSLCLGQHSDARDLHASLEQLHCEFMRTGCLQAALETSPLEELLGNSPLLGLLREVHTDTFFILKEQWIRTSRGSRPGSPLADMIFACLLLKLHRLFDTLLQEDPAVSAASATMGTQAYTLTWADDLNWRHWMRTN